MSPEQVTPWVRRLRRAALTSVIVVDTAAMPERSAAEAQSMDVIPNNATMAAMRLTPIGVFMTIPLIDR